MSLTSFISPPITSPSNSTYIFLHIHCSLTFKLQSSRCFVSKPLSIHFIPVKNVKLILFVPLGHCDVIETLVKLKADLNAKDEDGDTALHIVIAKRSNLNGEVNRETSPAIFKIYDSIKQVSENRLAIAIACYLIQMGIDIDSLNSRGQASLGVLQDSSLQELLKSFKPCLENNQLQQAQEAVANMSLDRPREGYNLADVSKVFIIHNICLCIKSYIILELRQIW